MQTSRPLRSCLRQRQYRSSIRTIGTQRGRRGIGGSTVQEQVRRPAGTVRQLRDTRGKVDGLPVGAMLIGRHYAEKTIYRAAHAYEQEVDWRGE